MPDTARPQPSVWRTPLRDLARFRVTGRLDWPGRLATSGLPDPVRALIGRVVKRTRLWKLEQAAVAAELAAHFADGLDAGADAETLARDFGDERTAAKLIRRAKRRGRPLPWHVWKWAVRGGAAVFGLYLLQLVPFVLRHPVVRVDYLARLNAPLSGVPQGERAWPLYRQAVLGMGLAIKDAPVFAGIDADEPGTELLDVKPGDPAWPQLVAWLDAHAGDVALLRQGAARPKLGFVLGPGGSAEDAALGWPVPHKTASDLVGESLVGVMLPDLNLMRSMARVLCADARYAAAQHRGATVVADLQAVLALGTQCDAPFLISQLVGIGVVDSGFDQIERVLADTPAVLDDGQLIGLAHRVGVTGGDTPGSLIDVNGERPFFYDLVQRMYSDDGHGDGILTATGARSIRSLMSPDHRPDGALKTVVSGAVVFGVGPLTASRRDLTAEYDRLMDLQSTAFSRPLRDRRRDDDPLRQFHDRLEVIQGSVLLSTRYLLIGVMAPAFERAAQLVERTLGRRDGLCVGLALEFYRRHHGAYPTTLDALVPDLLPRVPTDRIGGGPVKYRRIDGRPVVYSVGVDGDDDGGRPAALPSPRTIAEPKETSPTAAAEWPAADDPLPLPRPDGDWVLFDGRPRPSPATRPAD